MTTLTIPTQEYGSECRACELGASDYYCECLDEHRCWDCGERIAWQYDVTVDGEHYHQTCAERIERDE